MLLNSVVTERDPAGPNLDSNSITHLDPDPDPDTYSDPESPPKPDSCQNYSLRTFGI